MASSQAGKFSGPSRSRSSRLPSTGAAPAARETARSSQSVAVIALDALWMSVATSVSSSGHPRDASLSTRVRVPDPGFTHSAWRVNGAPGSDDHPPRSARSPVCWGGAPSAGPETDGPAGRGIDSGQT